MVQNKVKAGGGWQAIHYSFEMARKAGGVLKLYRALKSRNTCKTCALGMGGVSGGMKNELGQSFQVCKKSMQAQAQDMQPGVADSFFEMNRINDLKKLSGRELEALGRLVHPLYLPDGADRFKVLSWQEAHDLLLAKWQHVQPRHSFFYASGRSSMEAAFLLQLLARQWGANNINNCSYYCHQASGVGLAKSLGGGTSTVTLEDVQKSDLVVLIGANPASNHPRLITYLSDLRRRGGHVIVINPMQEVGLQIFKIPSNLRSFFNGSEIATFYLQPHCGGDLALLKAAACYMLKEGKADEDYLRHYCNDTHKFISDLKYENLQRLLDKSGVSHRGLQTLCNYLARSERTIFAWAMGITHQAHGVESVQAIANLALLCGMIGKPGAGLLPIRGHSNVQGVGSVGVTPMLKPAMSEAILRQLNIELPEAPGKDTFACMQSADNGEMDFALMLGGNLYGANPDLKWAQKALAKVDFTAHFNTTMNLGHLFGHGREMLVLPVRARDEEQQSTSQESMFNFVRLSEGGRKAPVADLPSESEILSKIARALLGDSPIPWTRLRDHREIRKFIADVVPNMQPIFGLDEGKEFTIPGRILHEPTFNTENGKANLEILSPPDMRPQEGSFNLMTLRSEGQFNTIVYEDADIYRGVSHRQVVFMNAEDIAENNFPAGERVWVESEVGRLCVELVAAPIRAGNVAMYFPEANELVPAKVDPQSRTPVFKHVAVKVYEA